MNNIVILAAGGTGGHVFPAQALADLLIERGFKPILVCDDRTNQFLYGSLNFIEKYQIKAPNLRAALQGSIIANILGLKELFWNTWKILFYLLKTKPTCIVGFGGYPAFPTMLAATLLDIPITIHEPNAYLGRVNRYFLPFVKALTTTIPNTLGIKNKYLTKVYTIGNPTRKKILNSKKIKNENDNFTILIIGGSQGTQAFSEIIPQAIKKLPEALQTKLKIYQQARPNLVDQTITAYTDSKAQVIINSFFENIDELYSQADLVICRSGSSTIFELVTTKIPAILVPYPHAMDNHQFYNAKYLVDAGCALLSLQENFSAEKLADELQNLIETPEKLEQMVNSYNKLDANDGTPRLLEIVLKNSKR